MNQAMLSGVVIYLHAAIMLTLLLSQTLRALKNICSTNFCKCPQHVYASIAKQLIHVHMDFRYAGDSATLQVVSKVSSLVSTPLSIFPKGVWTQDYKVP